MGFARLASAYKDALHAGAGEALRKTTGAARRSREACGWQTWSRFQETRPQAEAQAPRNVKGKIATVLFDLMQSGVLLRHLHRPSIQT